MKTHLPDDKMNAALMFYGDLALRSETVINTDIGFLSDDGEPVFADMDRMQAVSMNAMNTIMRETLAENQVDAQEVMQFFEMCLIAQKISGEEYTPPALKVHHITAEETYEQKEARRQTHLWECVQECIMAVQPDVLHVSDDGTGFGVDVSNAHPLLAMYVESIRRYDTDQFVQGTEAMLPSEVKDYLNDKTASLRPAADIDPDSDENDDDPFGMFV